VAGFSIGRASAVKLRAVTAFYDIGRGAADGRTAEQYLRWLNATLRLPLPFTIYLEPGQDTSLLELKSQDRIVRLPWQDLLPAKWLPAVEAICAQRSKFAASNDLNYRLPKYGPTNFAKLDLLAREATPEDEYLLWVDAGASRHTAYDLAHLRLRKGTLDAIMRGAELAIGARHHLYDYVRGRERPQFAGRCQTLTTGTILVVRTGAASRLRDVVFDHVEKEWLSKNLWDTEQTAIGEVILDRRISAVIPEEDRDWIGLLGTLFYRPGISWMGLRWDTPRGKYYKNSFEDFIYAVRASLIRAYRRAFVLRHRERYVAARLPKTSA
jgi:hypothetical protein